MECRDWCYFFFNLMFQLKKYSSLIMPLVHGIVGFTSILLESEDVQWGLYRWCSVKDGKTTQCHEIHPGESPAYFEVARTSTAFSVVMFFLAVPMFLWTPADDSTCKWLLKLVLTWLPSLNVGTTLGLVAAYYKDDDRWKDSNPSLNGKFNILVMFAVLDLVPTCYFFLIFALAFAGSIRDQQTRRQRQCRHSRPPPSAEPISNQGEKNQTLSWPRLDRAKIKASNLWRYLCRKLVTAMKHLKASIRGKRLSRKPVMTMESLKARSSRKRLSRKLVIIMKRLGPGTVQDLPDNPLRHQPGQPEGHGSPPIRHAPGGPAGDLPPRSVQKDASDTSSVRAGHSEGAARYDAADAYRLGDTTIHPTAGQGEVSRYTTMDSVIHQTAGQDDVSRYTTMDSVIHQTAGQDDVSRYTTMDSVIHQTAGQDDVSRYTTMDSVILQGAPPERSGRSAAMDPVIGQGGQEELSHSHSARDAPRVHSICRPQLTLSDFHSFVNPQTSRLTFQLRHPGQRVADPLTSTYM